MKFKVWMLCLVCVLSLAVALTGCATKNAKENDKRSKKTVASKKQNKATKDTSSQPADEISVESPKDEQTTDLTPGTQLPPALEQALNPLGSLKSSDTAPTIIPSGESPSKLKTGPLQEPVPQKMERPRPEQLLSVLQMRYASAKTFKTTGSSTGTMKADGQKVNEQSDSKSSFLFKRPNKFVIGSSDEKLITNGKVLVRYSPSAKRYVKSKLDKETEQKLMQSLVGSQMGIRSLGLLLGVDYASATSSMKLLKDEKVGGHETFVLRLNLKPGVGCPKGITATQTLWIGKKDMGIYKNRLVAKGKPQLPEDFKGDAPKSVSTTVNLVATKCEFDSDIPDSKFDFNPPAGVKPAEDPSKNYLQDKQAPDFAFTWTDGTRKKLSDLRDQVVVLDCWALPMCEKHLPVLQKTYEKYKDSAQIISICFNDDKKKVGEYLSENGFNFPVVYADKAMAEIFEAKYHLQIIPAIFILNKSGIVKDRMLGMPEPKDIDAKLANILQ